MLNKKTKLEGLVLVCNLSSAEYLTAIPRGNDTYMRLTITTDNTNDPGSYETLSCDLSTSQVEQLIKYLETFVTK